MRWPMPPQGEWRQMGNPCVSPGAETMFQSQSSFVMPIPGKKNSYIFLADRWNKTDLENSRYLWLPLQMVNGQPEIRGINTGG